MASLTFAASATAQAASISIPYGGAAVLQPGDTYMAFIGHAGNRDTTAIFASSVYIATGTTTPDVADNNGTMGSTDPEISVITGVVPAGTGNLVHSIAVSSGYAALVYRVDDGVVETGAGNFAWNYTGDSNPRTAIQIPALAAGATKLNVVVVCSGSETTSAEPDAVTGFGACGFTKLHEAFSDAGTRRVKTAVWVKQSDAAVCINGVTATSQVTVCGRFVVTDTSGGSGIVGPQVMVVS